jgi:hypothetical protein
MALFYRLLTNLSRPRRQIRRNESDEIFPLHLMDQQHSIRELVMSYTFRYNDVLNPEMLHDSLVKLLGMGDWRKLGGRLRLNVRY